MSTGGSQPAGWYHAQGDPPNTHRYWDGSQWVGGPQPIGGPGPGSAPGGFSGAPMVAGGRPLGGPWERIGARILDGLLVGIVSGVIAGILGMDGGPFALGRALLQTAIFAIYSIAMIGTRGATLGKQVLGLAVVRRADGVTPPGIDVAVKRWIIEIVGAFTIIGALVSLVIFVVSLVYLFTDPQRRTVHDRIADTLVVKTK